MFPSLAHTAFGTFPLHFQTDQSMSAKSIFSTMMVLLLSFLSLGLSAGRSNLKKSQTIEAVDTTAAVLRLFPMTYSYDAAGNRIQRTVQNGIIPPPIFPPHDSLVEPPFVGGGKIHP